VVQQVFDLLQSPSTLRRYVPGTGDIEVSPPRRGVGQSDCGCKDGLGALIAAVHLLASTTLGRFATLGGLTGDGQGVASQ
jgi:hypothetical protein